MTNDIYSLQPGGFYWFTSNAYPNEWKIGKLVHLGRCPVIAYNGNYLLEPDIYQVYAEIILPSFIPVQDYLNSLKRN